MNSGDSKDVKAITTSSLTEGSTTSPWTLIHAGANSTLSTSTTGDCNNGGQEVLVPQRDAVIM